MGSVCKHVVAVLFYIQQDVLDLEPKVLQLQKSNEEATAKKIKRKTISEQVDDVLEKITHDELKQFIQEKAEQNPSFRNVFLYSFAHQNNNESKEFYSKQVKSTLREASGREGFIHWNKAGSVAKQISELLNAAQKQIENKNFKSAIFICTAVMEEMKEALQFADDSSGDIGGCIDFAFELLFTIAKEKLPKEIRTQLFDYCLSSFEKQTYLGWDWHLGVLQIASEILNDEEEGQRLFSCLEKVQHSNYEKEAVQCIKLNIIRKTKGDEEAQKFIEQNLSNPNLRREAIQKSLWEKDYEKAIAISKDGIIQDEKSKPGLAIEWYDWLLKIAQAQKQKDKIIEYARLLLIDNFRHEQDYYQLLKSNIEPQLWKAFVEGLIRDITKKNRWLDVDLIAKIYIVEEWWIRLLELIKQKPSLSYIEHYEKYLSKDFSDELVLLYGNEIVKYLENNTGRNHYQTTCRYLRRMIKLDGREMVEKMVSDFRKQYPQRRALMEELNRIIFSFKSKYTRNFFLYCALKISVI
jgi:hypothetical protein